MTWDLKTILFIGGGIETLPAMRRAVEIGLVPIALDGDCECAAASAGFRVLQANIFNVQQCLNVIEVEATRGLRVDGVVSIASDCAFTAASLASFFGLPGNPLSAALASSHKLLMKENFSLSGLKSPRGLEVRDSCSLRDASEIIGFPAILKPVDGRGSRGVFRVGNPTEASELLAECLGESLTKTAMLQEYLPGPQFSSETILIEGRASTLGLSTRNYLPLRLTQPMVWEDGGELPPPHSFKLRSAIDAQAAALAGVLGLQSGSIKGDLVVHQGEIFWLEAALRVSGGFFATHEIPLSTRVSFVDLILSLALGEKMALPQPEVHAPVAQRYLWSSALGTHEIRVPKSVAEDPDLDVELFGRYSSPRSVSRQAGGGVLIWKVGVVHALGRTRSVAKHNATRAVKAIRRLNPGLVDLRAEFRSKKNQPSALGKF